MSVFPTRILSAVCDISMGQAPKGDSYNATGSGYPLIAGAERLDQVGIREAVQILFALTVEQREMTTIISRAEKYRRVHRADCGAGTGDVGKKPSQHRVR